MNRVRLNVLCGLLMCAAGLHGCKSPPDLSPSPGLGDPYPPPINDPQIAVLSPELRNWIAFHPTIVIDDGERPMSVEVPVRNLTARQYLIEYRVIFYDENDAEVEPVMQWEFQSMEPKQTERLKRKALSTEARTYRVEVKWSE